MPEVEALQRWLKLTWERPERSYNPDLREFLAQLLEYPKDHVVTEDRAGGGYADLKLLTAQKLAWVVGDLKKDDATLTNPIQRQQLWNDKKRYIDGITRWVLFITPNYIWVTDATGQAAPGLTAPIDLSKVTTEQLRETLAFIGYGKASHAELWRTFTAGTLPYCYLDLHDGGVNEQLRADLRSSFTELTGAATRAMNILETQYEDFVTKHAQIMKQLNGSVQRRAKVRLEIEYSFVRHLFEESIPQFQEQYGREVDVKGKKERERIMEGFIADSVAALSARILFLRLIEDLKLVTKRRLSNGGPANWNLFVENLTGDAKALVRVASEDAARLYKEPFASTVFDWINHANGELDESLQRFILRLNAYDFAGLDEELLGDIYQQFLPAKKRKQLGEFYTPPSVVDWILQETVKKHGVGRILDPSCGSGSFLVRYAHWRLADAKKRKLAPQEIINEIQDELWGFDLNPFAAFISYFQLIWAFLRFHPKHAGSSINVYNLNSLLRDDDISKEFPELIPPGSLERDQTKWKYIVGNPPYIRAERVKYDDEMQSLWSNVWGQNADTGHVFLYRAITEWLEEGGFLGMVVSGGYASSEAAAKVWKLLHPGGKASLRKIVWLEFTGRLWDANVIPLVVIIENTAPLDTDEIEIITPQSWNADSLNAKGVKVKYNDFWDKRVNPKVTDTETGLAQSYPWGDYLLPLLEPEDVAILKKVATGAISVSLGSVMQPRVDSRSSKGKGKILNPFTYGVQRGGVSVTENSIGLKPVAVIGGRDVSIASIIEGAGFVDLSAVAKRTNGKLSLWASGAPAKFIAIKEIALSPIAAVANGQISAALNTLIVGQADESKVKAEIVCTFLNSNFTRYFWASKLRSGAIQQFWAHFYPRTLEALPFPAKLSAAHSTDLETQYNQLTALATIAKDNPRNWLLEQLDIRLRVGRTKLSDPKLQLSFEDWGEDAQVSELELDGLCIRVGLFSFSVSDAALAELVFTMLSSASEDATVSAKDIQKLLVPNDYAALMTEYNAKLTAFKNVEQDFMRVLAQIDSVVYEAFGLTQAEREYIEARLASFPLNRLKPRYPWDTVKTRSIKAYTEDRFA